MGGWTYMLHCSDDSFYVGSTSYDDVNKRVTEHNAARYAGYTASRRPTKLVWSKWFDDLRSAHAMERQLKGWSRAKKIALMDGEVEAVKQLSARRGGKPRSVPKPTRRQLAVEFHSTGARHPEVRAAERRATKDSEV